MTQKTNLNGRHYIALAMRLSTIYIKYIYKPTKNKNDNRIYYALSIRSSRDINQRNSLIQHYLF